MSAPNAGDVVRRTDGVLGMVKYIVPAQAGTMGIDGTPALTETCELYGVEFEDSDAVQIVPGDVISVVGLAPQGW